MGVVIVVSYRSIHTTLSVFVFRTCDARARREEIVGGEGVRASSHPSTAPS